MENIQTRKTSEVEELHRRASYHEIEFEDKVEIIQAMLDEGYCDSTAEDILSTEYYIDEYGVKIPNYISDGPGYCGDIFIVIFGDAGILGQFYRTKNATDKSHKMTVQFMGELPSKELNSMFD